MPVTVHEAAAADRRRRAFRRVDPARIRARYLLRRSIRWPSARPASNSFRWPSTAWNGSSRTLPLAHPFDDGTAVVLERSLDATAANLGPDGEAWRSLMEPLVDAWPRLRHDVLAPARACRAIPS